MKAEVEDYKNHEMAESFMKDCHDLRDQLMSANKKVSHQDATNVWIYKKFAEFEIRLRNLETTKL